MHKVLKTIFVLFSVINSIISAASIPYIHPSPNAMDVRPQSTIILKMKQDPDIHLSTSFFAFKVSGSKSGDIKGTVKVIENTVIFKPHNHFNTGEDVSVQISSQQFKIKELSFTFRTSNTKDLYDVFAQNQKTKLSHWEYRYPNHAYDSIQDEPTVINGIAVPRDFPILQPFVNLEGTAPGRLFFSFMQNANPYIAILENDGTPYFYRKVERRTRDLKLQPTGHLSRMITPASGLSQGWEILDSTYKRIGVYSAKNGYSTDDHEFKMLLVK